MSAAQTSSATEYAIETEGLTRRFGDFVAVDNILLKIPKGQLYGFLGLNGAEKLLPFASLPRSFHQAQEPRSSGVTTWS